MLGGLLGCVLAIVFASSRLLERGLLPFVVGSQTVPILAIAPMVVVGLGQLGAPDWLAKAVVAAYLTFFPGDDRHAARPALGPARCARPDALLRRRRRGQTFWKLRLPAALPLPVHLAQDRGHRQRDRRDRGRAAGRLAQRHRRRDHQGGAVLQLAARRCCMPRCMAAAAIGLCFYGAVALAEKLIVRERKAE